MTNRLYLVPYVHGGFLYYDYEFSDLGMPPLTDAQRAQYKKIYDDLRAWVKVNNIKIVVHKAREIPNVSNSEVK